MLSIKTSNWREGLCTNTLLLDVLHYFMGINKISDMLQVTSSRTEVLTLLSDWVFIMRSWQTSHAEFWDCFSLKVEVRFSFMVGIFLFKLGQPLITFLTFYPYKLKFETLLDTFKIQNLVVLVCQHFNFFGGKMTSQNGLKILIFYFRSFCYYTFAKYNIAINDL